MQARYGKLIKDLLSSPLHVPWGSGGENAALHGNASPQNHPSAMALTAFVHDGVGSFVDRVSKRKSLYVNPGDLDSLRLALFPIIG